MEELTRRKSNSSESELSDGWNLVDAVEVLPVETSDNESVEVIQDEVSDDQGMSEGEKKTFKTNSNPEGRIESLNSVEEKNEERNKMKEWSTFFHFKEFCEVTAVFLVIVAMGLSSSYSLLMLEEGISSAKPMIWDMLSSGLGSNQQFDLEKMKSELDSLKEENLKLVSELHKLHKALESSTENENIYLKSSSRQSFSKEVENSMGEDFLNKNAGIQKLDTSSSGFDFSDYKMFVNVFKDTQKNDFKSHLEFFSSIQNNLEQILLVTTNYSLSNTSFPIHKLIEDFETINIVSVDEKLSAFASKWDNKFKSFIANILSDLVKMTKKLSSNLNKKLVSFHLKFLSKLCDKVIHLESATLNTRQKEICSKHLEASSNGMTDKKIENSKKYFKPIKEKTSTSRKDSSVEKNIEGDIEVNSDKHGSEGNRDASQNSLIFELDGDEHSFYQQVSDKSRRKKRQETNSNKIKNESLSNKKANHKKDSQQNHKNPKNERDLKKSKKETSTKKIKESIICNEDDGGVQVESKIVKSDNDPSKNKRGNNQNAYESDDLEKNEKTDLKNKKNIKKKKVLDVDKYETKVKQLTLMAEENKIISQESSVILPSEEYKKKSNNLKNGSNKSDHKMNKQGKKQNTNSTGAWFLSMGESRAHIRNEHQKSEWLFERARARLKSRDNSRWTFDRAWVRQRCRESPKSSLCWQRNIPGSFFTKSSDAFS